MMGFNLSSPMGYVDISLYFCMDTEMVADLSKNEIDQQDVASAHPLYQVAKSRAEDGAGAPKAQADARWEQLTAEQR